jgi:hypothetical protein
VARAAEIAITVAAAGVAGALKATMALQPRSSTAGPRSGSPRRWSGVSLAAGLIHELTSEHVRRELEIERPTPLEAEPVEAQEPDSAMARGRSAGGGNAVGRLDRAPHRPSRLRGKAPTTSPTAGLRQPVVELYA